ncbi:hypothetical protein [Paraburkholderia rhizosphaerae]|uniref:hypothetical protein n=1 Tax=Paraburkholderia rhizosphaerae TaxID=480658 RepID=UPI0014170FF3|nr:hypothetical protein [Paraburkholderia rhizosphaerae]
MSVSIELEISNAAVDEARRALRAMSRRFATVVVIVVVIAPINGGNRCMRVYSNKQR